jgi:hypothetical protein
VNFADTRFRQGTYVVEPNLESRQSMGKLILVP